MPSYYEKIAGMFSEEPTMTEPLGYQNLGEVGKDAWTAYKNFRERKTREGKEAISLMGRTDLTKEEQGKVDNFLLDSMDFGGAGVVKRAKLAGPRIREVMAREFRSRGAQFKAAPHRATTLRGESATKADAYLDVRELLDYVTRGPWFHGRRTYPKAGETFGRSRIGHTNLGEPTGISLTGTESIAAKFAKEIPVRRKAAEKLQHKMRKLADARLQRFLESKVGQRANKEYNQGMAAADRATTFAEKQRLDNITAEKYYLFQDRMFNTMPETKKITGMARSLDKLGVNEDIFARVVPRFGKPPADVILPAWKGPGTEYAQEILKDAYSDAARVVLRRTMKPGELKARTGALKVNPGQSGEQIVLRNTLDQERNAMNEMIVENLQKKGYKGLLYSPGRFGEHELKMFNPQDVMMLDLRRPGHTDPGMSRLMDVHPFQKEFGSGMEPKGRQALRLDKWNAMTEDLSGHSLRDIYEDIDLLKLHDEVMGDVKMPKAGYNPDITTKIKLDKAKKAELIKALPKGFADEVGVTLENLSNESLKALKKAADQGMTPFEAWIEASK